MPSYRLLAGHATVLEDFVAADDAEAIDRARELTQDVVPTGPDLVERGGFRLEKNDHRGWHVLFAWFPQQPIVPQPSWTWH